MKTLFYPSWDKLEIAEYPRPTPKPDEVLLRVAACGLCGSELETFKDRNPRRQPPLVMGHEYCGVIEEVGADVSTFGVGEKVVGNALISCGQCVRCERGDEHLCAARQILGMHRQGAFAQWVAIPERVLIPWPDALAATEACLAEPLANGVHVVNLTRHIAAKNVLVIGAGPIGLLTLQAFKALTGANLFICDLNQTRVEVAKGFGGITALDSKSLVTQAKEVTGGEGMDIVVDAVGTAGTKSLALDALRPGGATVWIGLHQNEMSLHSYGVTLAEKQIIGTYSAKKDELATALELMASGELDVTSWTKKFPLEAGIEAFECMLAAQDDNIKAIILPNGENNQ